MNRNTRSADAVIPVSRSKDSPPSSAKLGDLLRAIPLQSIQGSTDVELSGVSIDSRQVDKGFLFVAVKGASVDGHQFVDQAIERGALAIVSENPPSRADVSWVQTPDARRAAGILAAKMYGEPSKKLELVGITGTNGKTTIAYLLDGLVSRLAPPSIMLGTVVQKLGEDSTPTRHTTPEASDIQAFLASAVRHGARYGAIEVSSHGLQLARLSGSEFAVAVFTNLSRDHLDFHGDMEAYFKAKRALFNNHLRPSGTAVISIDDAYGERLAAELAQTVLTFGSSRTADLCLVEARGDLNGLEVRFSYEGEESSFTSPLIGSYNAMNLLGVVGASLALGFDLAQVTGLLATISGAPGRFERVEIDAPFSVIVDYAHTDDALRKLLEAARPLTDKQLTVVFGCGGDRDRSKRPLMGDVATRLADRVVITSDNPRTEEPAAIVREIEVGARGAAEVIIEVDRRRAIALALKDASAGDLIVVAGKGHEAYQVIGSDVLDFDDRLIVRELMEAT